MMGIIRLRITRKLTTPHWSFT